MDVRSGWKFDWVRCNPEGYSARDRRVGAGEGAQERSQLPVVGPDITLGDARERRRESLSLGAQNVLRRTGRREIGLASNPALDPSDQFLSQDVVADIPRKIFAQALHLVVAHGPGVMRQLTLECGYSTAALRERIYISDGEDGVAGLLIYTATSDSDGTLGGLQLQGESARIERAVEAAIHAMEWCSSDPLCIEGMIAGSDGLSLAACHACFLAPETACEEYNRFLDRASLVGLPNATGVGFFSPLLRSA
jgi:hypothetical protein